MTARAIFLDDGGVMNDNEVRGRQWQRLVGEYLSPRLGGSQEAWSAANTIVARRVWRDFLGALEREPGAEFATLSREMDRSWSAGMCEIVGIEMPSRDACISLTRETAAFVTRRVRAAYPGTVEALRALRSRGYALATASGEISPELEGYLEGMGVRGLFTLPLFGPDIVNVHKHCSDYYERIFAHADVAASDAIVVDDAPEVLEMARQLGAHTVLVTSRGAYDGNAHVAIEALRDLPALIESIFP